MELNVKQSGIEKRVFRTTFYKTRSGKFNKRVHELYLRNDLPCGLSACSHCHYEGQMKPILFEENAIACKSAPFRHCLLIDGPTILRFIDVLDNHEIFRNLIILQSVWAYVKKMNSAIYKRMNAIYTENAGQMFVFLNEFVSRTFVESGNTTVPELFQEKCLLKSAIFFLDHWKALGIRPLLLCSSDETKVRLGKSFENCLTLLDYARGIGCETSLLERLEDLCRKESRGKALYPEYWTQDQLLDGILKGTLKKGKFKISSENYLEAFIEFELEDQWFVKGTKCMNRAVHGDVVVAELLPEEEWSAPESVIRLRDADEGQTVDIAPEEEEEQSTEESEKSTAKKARKDVLPSARIVGILRRNWRHYCGVLLHSNMPGGRQFLFAPTERLIPRIRIETSHFEQLKGKKILVQIDTWPQDSHYPKGHYVRVIGDEGDRKTEDEVILLEHDIPYEDFPPSVMACLPKIPWSPFPMSPDQREDLTHIDICSVDPEGCTDIDDALHCIEICAGKFEVGVHIADVTHFVRPGSAMDTSAAERSTTVYLCGRRIDMLPELLSSNLCSLREGQLRYAFSVIWTLDAEANIEKVRFCKSLIRSRAALTYQKAQEMVDGTKIHRDNISLSLRNLLFLSRQLKSRRRTMGALELASSEIRFDVDRETGTPLKVQEKQHLETMSMVEEFMLLANISVAEKILSAYPDCAILRRHPTPGRLSFKPLIGSCGFKLNVDTSKELAKSLDEVEQQCRQSGGRHNPMVARMLRMLATRCMTQAVYFAAGTVSRDHYLHYGLAVNVYTHFTSPIRRYADVMVHRLLAALLEIEEMHPNMLDRKRLIRQAENMNRRHRHAQYASRASVLLNTFLMVKECPEKSLAAIVIGISSNGIKVMVPKFGLESVIYLNRGGDGTIRQNVTWTQQRMAEFCASNGISLFREVKVSVAVVEHKDQRKRIDLKLVDPVVDGLSIVMDCETNI
uniref:Protein DIS3 homolog n=1 Tax=Globodera rostochiensis TaxID=31243 RepID=A0A914HZ11_GLORO